MATCVSLDQDHHSNKHCSNKDQNGLTIEKNNTIKSQTFLNSLLSAYVLVHKKGFWNTYDKAIAGGMGSFLDIPPILWLPQFLQA